MAADHCNSRLYHLGLADQVAWLVDRFCSSGSKWSDYDFDADHIEVYYRQAKDYLVYFVMAALYGMILPFFFLVTGKVKIVFPSVISIGMGVLMLIGLVLFKGKEMRQEIEKNLHV